ncbi:MAG: GerMN domain-containing protein [Thermomicrobiales bacterium]
MAQIVFTLTRFDEIQSVQFRIAGQPIDALDSDGATVFRPYP